MNVSNHLVVLITAGSRDEAGELAGALVRQKKAACVNIVPGIKSLFRYKNEIEEENETLLIVKTRRELFPGVIKLVRELHSYEVPEIICTPVRAGDPDYLAWVRAETRER